MLIDLAMVLAKDSVSFFCFQRFISSDAYKKHRHGNHIVKSTTINSQNVMECQCKQQKAKGKRYHYHCFKCLKPVLKFNYKKHIGARLNPLNIKMDLFQRNLIFYQVPLVFHQQLKRQH